MTSLAIIMITLNEQHNIQEVIDNIADISNEIFVLDSFSSDRTIEILKKNKIIFKQKKFINFGDQWNYALNNFKIKSKWTMKLDPDERLSQDLKKEINYLLAEDKYDFFSIKRRLWFMNRKLNSVQKVERIWKTGSCKFSDVMVNEKPLLFGKNFTLKNELKHLDSPNLNHWIKKQNMYSDFLAKEIFLYTKGKKINSKSMIEKRILFYKLPFKYSLLFFYHYFFLGAWKMGSVGYQWSYLRCFVYRLTELKYKEMNKYDA
tara:strand:- start:3239 stop:4021 length:783 start_codon:yes stop_codon:yes gene_type:complete